MIISTLSNLNIALPSVFNKDESLNLESTINLIHLHIKSQVPALLISGSTGEQHSLKLSEKLDLLDKIEQVNITNKIQIIFGVSAIWQKEAVELAKAIEKTSIAAIMIGFPPYIKPSQKQALHYARSIIEAADKPVILYNNSQRTGFDLSTDSIIELAKDKRVVGLKDTSELARIQVLKQYLPDDFLYFIGGESELLERLSAGFNAISSVAGNLFPNEVKQILDLYLTGNRHQAAQKITQLHTQIAKHDTNGLLLGIKKELTLRGNFAGYCRSPIIDI